MKYVLLTYGNPQPGGDDGEDPLLRAIPRTGEWMAGAALADPVLARTLRVHHAAPDRTDGPFAESPQQLTGFWLVDCENLDRAFELAELLCGARVAAVEIRPLMDPSGISM